MSTAKTLQMMTPAGRALWSCRFLLALMLVALVSACATSKPKDDPVKERAQARWDALLSKDYDTAYSFYSPGYRSSTSRVDFEIGIRARRVAWVSAEVQKISCEADSCSVETLVGYKVARPVPGLDEWKNKNEVTERWVRTDGQWWYLPD